ncbi:MFS transporter [Nonomuraea soli]|uniref:DHA2 family multidrug resistance protein-like MFS transporter n=1 Tax=Nonomuraea soli TaxID=1032476 RepID=A0A7W0HVB3_9ACTN|nr:MFS transporter [Nonomuraea soli]MBA2896842.1 DHA2 family multidrug resistance protein-like MFS transporter [Nonomuraea soli]
MKWFGLAVLSLPTILLFLAMTVLFLATPHIAADLRPTDGQLLWINDIYGFMMAGLLVAMGTVGDRIGRRKVLMFGAVAFGVASAFAAFTESASALIAARAVMGIGAAAVMPSTLSLISNMFTDARERATAIGVWAASISVGVAIGPLVGGLVLESFWWGAALLIGVPVMALVVVAAPFAVPEYRNAEAGRPDVASVLMSMAALLPIVYGVKELAKAGVTPTAVVTILAGLAFGVAFVRRQLRLEQPLLDVRLFANKVFSGALAVFLLGAIALGGVYLLFTQYLQLVAGLSPLESGLWILPAALALVAVSTLSPIWARRVQPAYVVAGGLLVSAIGYLVMTQVGSVAGLPMLITGFYILYPGIAPTMALTTNLVIGSAPPEKAGAASAVNTTASDLGVSLGVAILGSVGAAVYGSQVSTSFTDALTSGDEALIARARDAFTDGLNVASGAAAVLALGAAALSLTLLRAKRHKEALVNA